MMLECSPKQKFNSRGVAQKVACVVRDYEAESSNLSTPTRKTGISIRNFCFCIHESLDNLITPNCSFKLIQYSRKCINSFCVLDWMHKRGGNNPDHINDYGLFFWNCCSN